MKPVQKTLPLPIPILLLWSAALLFGCADVGPILPEPLKVGRPLPANSATAPSQKAVTTGIEETPKPPVEKLSTAKDISAPPAPAVAETANITLMFDQLPLPTFIQVVYGNILKQNFTMDPLVASRNDLVTIRAANPQTPSQIKEAARMLLKSYGIAVTDLGNGFLRIVPDNAQQGYAPEIRRGRALPEVPVPLRPVFQLVEMQAVRSSDVAGFIKTMFGAKIKVEEDGFRNAVLLSGQSDDVLSAMEAIQVLDQPQMKGRQSVRINPVYWSADELAKKLAEVLQAEGYAASSNLVMQAGNPVNVLPIQAINAVIVFSADPAIIAHVVKWAQEFDKPATNRGAGSGYVTYQALYADAQNLAKTLQDLMSGAAATGAAAAAGKRPGRVVVNAATNTLIIQGGGDEYTQLVNLLQELDKPAKGALIEVTVAEVSLKDLTQLGVEFSFTGTGGSNTTINGGTLGNLGLPQSGLFVRQLGYGGNVRVALNALATRNKANILSSPRILARNGETATIQVGQEVPIVTSNQTTPTTGSSGSILQTVQYRNTGVILKVKPIIYSGDRIELEVSQEVSDADKTVTGVSSSPTFNTKKVDTRLSLKDGSTVMLGGMISSKRTRGEAGIPWLKDIPLLGQLFRTNEDNDEKTELLVLITPYIVSDDHDAQAITEAFRKQLGAWAHSKAQIDAANPPEQIARPPNN